MADSGSPDASVELLQIAVRKVKTVYDDLGVDLEKLRNRDIVEQEMQHIREMVEPSSEPLGKDGYLTKSERHVKPEPTPNEPPPLFSEDREDTQSVQSEGYIAPQHSISRIGLEYFWKRWPEPELYTPYEARLGNHERECLRFAKELEHLQAHYDRVGGSGSVKIASGMLQEKVINICEPLKAIIEYKRPFQYHEMNALKKDACNAYGTLVQNIDTFQKALYEQKHAFYFRKVCEWHELNKNAYSHLSSCSIQNPTDAEGFIKYIMEDFLYVFEKTMASVTDELRNFGERALPTFLADEKERATTRYVNITTIATFFSSVTATTLQMSTTITPHRFYDVVNLFWFVSLVFSVSSGVSSLLGMTWRKSSIYDTTNPPWPIRLWLDKAPMIFLVISALMFIIGLNLFVYLSTQAHYVSFSTNAFTGVHSLCLFVVVVWFIYRLKHENVLVKWTEAALSRGKNVLLSVLLWGKNVLMDVLFRWKHKLMYILSGWKATAIAWVSPLYENDRIWHYQRNICFALGFDGRVLQLNFDMRQHWNWPSSPNSIAAVTRSSGRWVSSILRRLRWRRTIVITRQDTEATAERGKVVERAMTTYRKALQNTFGSSERVPDVIKQVRLWMNGALGDHQFKLWLDQALWGYPYLADTAVSELTAIRRANRGQELATSEVVNPKNEQLPPSEFSAALWAHAKAEDVNTEYLKEGPGWYALFNPEVERSLDVSLVHTLKHDRDVMCARFSADGSCLAIGCYDGTTQTYDVATGTQSCILRGNDLQGALYSVCFSPAGNYLAAAGECKQITVWDLESRIIRYSFKGHEGVIGCIDFSEDGRFIVSGSYDGTARIWYLETGSSTILNTNDSEGRHSGVLSIAISHDKEIIAAGCGDGKIRVWVTQTGCLVELLTSCHVAPVCSVAFMPDGKGLIGGGSDNKVKYWDLTPFLNHEARTEPLPSRSLSASMSTLSYAPSTIAPSLTQGAGESGSVCTLTFDGHINWVRCVTVDHDGKWVVSGSYDGIVMFWDSRNAQALIALHGHKGVIWSVDASPTGGMLATGSQDKTIRIWSYKHT